MKTKKVKQIFELFDTKVMRFPLQRQMKQSANTLAMEITGKA